MRNLAEYYRPSSLADALELLSRLNAGPIKFDGGARLSAESAYHPGTAVDLCGLPLAYVESGATGLRIGSLTPLQDIAESLIIQDFAAGIISKSAQAACTSLMRRWETLAGALLSADSSGELLSALLVLDAEVVFQSAKGSFPAPLESFTGMIAGPASSEPPALFAEVRVPVPMAGMRFGRSRIARTSSDRAILSVTASIRMTGDLMGDCLIAMSGAGLKAMRIRSVEAVLAGSQAGRETIVSAIRTKSSLPEIPERPHASSDYCRAVLPVLIARAIVESSR